MTFSSQRNDTALVFVVNKLCFYKYILHWAHAHTAFQGTWQVGCFMNPAEFQFSGWKELFEIFVSTWVELQQFVCLIFLTKVWQFHKNLLLVQKHICHHRSSSLPANWTMSTAFFFTMTFVRLKRKQSFHGHWSQRRNTSSTVRNPPHPPVCRVGELISSPSLMTQVDSSDFFLLHQHFLKSSQKANEM